MTTTSEWVVGTDAWAQFVLQHPELGFKAGKWPFHNFLRFHRRQLVAVDAIRLAKRRFWIAHQMRFALAAFDCATGVWTTDHGGDRTASSQARADIAVGSARFVHGESRAAR